MPGFGRQGELAGFGPAERELAGRGAFEAGLDLGDRLARGLTELEVEPEVLGGLLQRKHGSDRADAAQRFRRGHPEVAVLAPEGLEQRRLGGRASGRSQSHGRDGGQVAFHLRHRLRQCLDRRGSVAAERLQAGAGRLEKTLIQGAGEDLAQAFQGQLGSQARDGPGAGGVVLRAVRELQEDVAALLAQLQRRPQPDRGARIRAGAAERIEGLRIARVLADQEEQVGEPHPGLGVVAGVLRDLALHVHGLVELPADVEKDRQDARELLLGDLRPQPAVADLQGIAVGARAEELAAQLRIEQRAHGPDRPLDEELVVELLVSDLDLLFPELEELAA